MLRTVYVELQERAAAVVQQLFPFVTADQIEIAGFGKEKPKECLLALLNLFNQQKTSIIPDGGFCDKLLILLPGENGEPGPECPMHHHRSKDGWRFSKNEGFWVAFGGLILRDGKGIEHGVLAGETVYLPAGARHAMRAADLRGCIVFEFSDLDQRTDIFDDPAITRDPKIEEDVPSHVPLTRGFIIRGEGGLQLAVE